MADQVAPLSVAKRLVLARATAWPTSRTSGALAVPFSVFTALTSCWLVPSGRVELILMPYLAVKADRMAREVAHVGGSAMTLSVPSVLAAATSAFMPPPAAAEVSVAQLAA